MRTTSRISRIDERRTKKRLYYLIGGIFGLLILIAVVAIPLIVNVSAWLANMDNSSTPLSSDTTPPLPPTFESLPNATNSATLKIAGYGESQTTITLLLNGEEEKTAVLPLDGTFSFDGIKLNAGENIITGFLTDQAGNNSPPSSELKINFKKSGPKLEISEPQEGKVVDRSPREITVSGKTDIGSQVYVNDRFVSVKDDGAFIYTFSLSDGENTIQIVSRDLAGNQTSEERKVTFNP